MWNHEIPPRKNSNPWEKKFGPTKYYEKNFGPMKQPGEKMWTHEIPPRKKFQTHEITTRKKLDTWRHGGTMGRDPGQAMAQEPRNLAHSVLSNQTYIALNSFIIFFFQFVHLKLIFPTLIIHEDRTGTNHTSRPTRFIFQQICFISVDYFLISL